MNKKGFTIIELLVVIAIIGIISGVMVINFNKGEQNNKLQRSAQQIVQSIRKAQNLALSSVEFGGQIYDYYGVHFDKQAMSSSYYVFASLLDKIYDSGEEVETINLEQDIIINSISPIQNNKLDIIFLPPHAFVEFNPNATDATIIIKNQDGTCPQNCRYIKINDKGWMSIENNP